jgi:Spy/CpxP family protein refolding chaperone
MKFSRHFVGTALLAALLAPCAHAAGVADAADVGHPAGQAAASPGDDGPRHGFGARGPGAPGPDAPPFHSVLHALHRLDLSEAQQDKLFAITHAAAPRQREQEKAERKAHEALLALGASASFDEARAGAAARDLGQAIANGALLRARIESQVLALLTPEQREQLRAHRPPGPRGRQPYRQPDGRPDRQPDQASAPE